VNIFTHQCIHTPHHTHIYKMDLSQRKLIKREWEGMEVPVNATEMRVLQMIVAGYDDPNINANPNQSLFSYLKTPISDGIHEYLYARFLAPDVSAIHKKYSQVDISGTNPTTKSSYKPNSRDIIRIDRSAENLGGVKSVVFEFILIDNLKKLARYESKGDQSKVAHTWYSMNRILHNKIVHVNPVLLAVVRANLVRIEDGVSVRYLLRSAAKIMERNELVIECRDEALYDHQKQVYNIFRQNGGTATTTTIQPRPVPGTDGHGKDHDPAGVVGIVPHYLRVCGEACGVGIGEVSDFHAKEDRFCVRGLVCGGYSSPLRGSERIYPRLEHGGDS